MNRRRVTAGLAAATAAALLPGCAAPPAAIPDAQGPWLGRLSLRIAADPPQSYAAAFELRGDAASGSLQLSTPLGTVLAQLNWAPGQATLVAEGSTRSFASVQDMTRSVTGAEWPLEALFGWLRGAPGAFAGWAVEQDDRSAGRLRLRRDRPEPVAELRIVLD